MARYIDMNELLNAIDKRNGRLPLWLDEILMEDCKVADVAPVVHGRWLNFYNDYSCAECDRCGTTFEVTDSESNEGLWNAFKLSYNYCPNCGAKMDEEEHDNNV